MTKPVNEVAPAAQTNKFKDLLPEEDWQKFLDAIDIAIRQGGTQAALKYLPLAVAVHNGVNADG